MLAHGKFYYSEYTRNDRKFIGFHVKLSSIILITWKVIVAAAHPPYIETLHSISK